MGEQGGNRGWRCGKRKGFCEFVTKRLGEVGREEDGREMVETAHVVMRMQVDSSKRQGQVDGDGDSGGRMSLLEELHLASGEGVSTKRKGRLH